ncbi:MAG TPA: hypothetical protein VJZ00_10565 [Thermoanaerobaculia bacterium]|nr:hypothetical protein [Thermoanaerobaculia bacterium]
MNEQFLVSPELFPARIAGEVWGTESVTIELAGERYLIDGLSRAQRKSVELRFSESRTGGDVTVRVFRAPRSDFREIDTRGWEYALQLDWTEHAIAMAGLRLMARADLANARAGLWTCVENEDEFSGVLENVLRPILATRLLANSGLLVHSASVDGWLFPSPSGGGKSTIARMGLDRGLAVLSDDLNAVVDRMILPLPFTGDLEQHDLSTTATPLRGIVALEKGDHEALRPLAMAEAVSLLVRCAPYVNQDPLRMPLLLERAAELASASARAVLTFRRGADVWPILNASR